MADAVEDTAVDTARRSEGIIFAARGFAGKMAIVSALCWPAQCSRSSICRVPKPEDVEPDVPIDLVLFAAPLKQYYTSQHLP